LLEIHLTNLIYTTSKATYGGKGLKMALTNDYDLILLDLTPPTVGNMDQMKSVDLLKRELIANVSHDLITPLAVLKGYIKTLQMKRDTTVLN